jgi:DNA/RNA endonuclease YhcR with UshA esterase domain
MVKNTSKASFVDKTNKAYNIPILSDETGTMDLKIWNNVAAIYHADETLLPAINGDVLEIRNVVGHVNSYKGTSEWQLWPITDKAITDFDRNEKRHYIITYYNFNPQTIH